MEGYAAIALHRPKTTSNVGSALRAVGVYGAAMMPTDESRRNRRAAQYLASKEEQRTKRDAFWIALLGIAAALALWLVAIN